MTSETRGQAAPALALGAGECVYSGALPDPGNVCFESAERSLADAVWREPGRAAAVCDHHSGDRDTTVIFSHCA